jgi:hypothetical protein
VSAANAATVALQYRPPSSDTGTGQPAIAANPVDSAVADPGTPGAGSASSGGSSTTVRRASPALRIRSARYSRGRLVITGRTAAGAAGRLSITARSGRHSTVVRRTINGGSFRLRIRTARPRSITLRFAGSALLLPATVRGRVTTPTNGA